VSSSPSLSLAHLLSLQPLLLILIKLFLLNLCSQLKVCITGLLFQGLQLMLPLILMPRPHLILILALRLFTSIMVKVYLLHTKVQQHYLPFFPLKLTIVLHVPEITKILLSVSHLTLDNNVRIKFSSNCCFVKDKETNQTLLHGILHRGIYQLVPHSSHQVLQVSQSSSHMWHCRVGHCSSSIQHTLQKANLISIKPSSTSSLCSDYYQAKAHKLPFLPSTSTTSKPLEVIHLDLWGPAPVLSTQGHRYYIHFIDEFSRFS
jgi:hypothetical protein